MTPLQLIGFNPKTFIDTSWQKKPVLLKNVLPHFVDPIDENDLAALAQEELMDSRIISQNDGRWTMTQGPFTEFEPFCIDQWSLLVQGVEHLIQDTQSLLNLFNFIPNWRIDDLMVSYSVPGAGVGPHIDQYDVFIIQGKGKRHWQVGLPGEYNIVHPHPKLTQIESFEPIIDDVLESGDILYIPPGCPHNGVAVTECLNYSIGFRAPDQQQLFENIADFMLDSTFAGERYSDPSIELREHPAQINMSEVEGARQLLNQWLDSDKFEDFFARMASFNQVASQQLANDECYTTSDILTYLKQGECFTKLAGIKPTYIQRIDDANTESFTFYIEKTEFSVPLNIQKDVKYLLTSPHYQSLFKERKQFDDQFIQLLTALVNAGYWYLE